MPQLRKLLFSLAAVAAITLASAASLFVGIAMFRASGSWRAGKCGSTHR